jgi:hypothetical protein
VAEARVRAEQEEEVREAGHRGAEVRARTAVPGVGEQTAAAPADLPGGRVVGHPEAGAEDDRVDLPLDTGHVDHRPCAHLGDALGDELDVGLGDRRVPAAGRQHALAADLVLGRHALAQDWIGDLARHVPPRAPLDDLHQRRPLDQAEHERLTARVDSRADDALQHRQAPVEPALEAGDRPRRVRQDPWRRALEDVQALHLGLDGGHVLDRRGAGADRGDPLAVDVEVVVPAG